MLLLLPPLLGGLQFTLFQGNHHDTFNYLESALSHSYFSYSFLKQDHPLVIDTAGGFHYAHQNLATRPTVAILYGVLSLFQPAYAVGNHYLFLSSFMAAAIIIVASLIEVLFPSIKTWQAIGLSGATLLGFWGQYIIDINSWSQLAWFPLFASALIYPLLMINDGESHAIAFLHTRGAICWILTLVGCVYLYPEGASFSFAPLAVLLISSLIKSRNTKAIPFLFLTALLFSTLFIPIFSSNIVFLVQQKQQSLSSVDWWRYFHAFFGGRDGFTNDLSPSLADGFAGALGIYYITPSVAWPIPASVLARCGILLLFCAVVLICSAVLLSKKYPNARLHLLAVCFLLLVAGSAFFISQHQFWTTGKTFSFYAPIAMSVILACLLYHATHAERRRSGVLAVFCLSVLVLGDVYFSLCRVAGATRLNGIHFKPPYPAIQGEVLKTSFNYGDTSFLKSIAERDYVAVNIDNPWVEEYVQLLLLSHDRHFYLERPVLANRYSEQVIGKISPQKDATLRLSVAVDEKRRFPSFIVVTRIAGANDK